MGVHVEWGEASRTTGHGIVVISPARARDWFGDGWEIPQHGYVLTLDLGATTVALTGTSAELQSLATAFTTATDQLDGSDAPRDRMGELRAEVAELHALYRNRESFDDDHADDYGTGLDSYDRHEIDHLYAIAAAAEKLLGIPAVDFTSTAAPSVGI